MAVPGSIVGVGKLITPGGQTGPKGDAGTAANVPLADITQNGLLRQNTGKTTDFVDGTNNCQAIVPQITSVRLRSFNAIGNPNFEVTQRNCGSGSIVIGTAATPIEDRWFGLRSSTATFAANIGSLSGPVTIPGLSDIISNRYLRVVIATAQASLGVSDYLIVQSYLEGTVLRELFGAGHSAQLLVRSSLTNPTFAFSLRDNNPLSKSLVMSIALGAANTWTTVALPNLPAWAAGGNWSTNPGSPGYILGITLASGPNFQTASGVWVSGNLFGLNGQTNLAGTLNATFDIAFCQHEPGPLCTTLQDKPFSQNLDECLRYYQKSHQYSVVPGAASSPGEILMYNAAGITTTAIYQPVRFPKVMAKAPNITYYSSISGAINNVRNNTSGVDIAASGSVAPGDSGYSGVTLATGIGANNVLRFHHTADTGW